jgi:hypothetical protein
MKYPLILYKCDRIYFIRKYRKKIPKERKISKKIVHKKRSLCAVGFAGVSPLSTSSCLSLLARNSAKLSEEIPR